MPIYEYKCNECHKVSEILVGVGSEKQNVNCSFCGSKRVEKVFSVMSVGKGKTPDVSPCSGACPITNRGLGGLPCGGGTCPL